MAKKKKLSDCTYLVQDTAEPWPDVDGTWTHVQWVAHVKAMQAEDDAYVPTAEEREMGKHFMRKQESASGWNQVDPNAD